jgi:hypothetical protein
MIFGFVVVEEHIVAYYVQTFNSMVGGCGIAEFVQIFNCVVGGHSCIGQLAFHAQSGVTPTKTARARIFPLHVILRFVPPFLVAENTARQLV